MGLSSWARRFTSRCNADIPNEVYESAAGFEPKEVPVCITKPPSPISTGDDLLIVSNYTSKQPVNIMQFAAISGGVVGPPTLPTLLNLGLCFDGFQRLRRKILEFDVTAPSCSDLLPYTLKLFNKRLMF